MAIAITPLEAILRRADAADAIDGEYIAARQNHAAVVEAEFTDIGAT